MELNSIWTHLFLHIRKHSQMLPSFAPYCTVETTIYKPNSHVFLNSIKVTCITKWKGYFPKMTTHKLSTPKVRSNEPLMFSFICYSKLKSKTHYIFKSCTNLVQGLVELRSVLGKFLEAKFRLDNLGLNCSWLSSFVRHAQT